MIAYPAAASGCENQVKPKQLHAALQKASGSLQVCAEKNLLS